MTVQVHTYIVLGVAGNDYCVVGWQIYFISVVRVKYHYLNITLTPAHIMEPQLQNIIYTHVFGVLIETEGNELFESLGVGSLQFRRVALGDEEEDSHGMEVCVRRLSVG